MKGQRYTPAQNSGEYFKIGIQAYEVFEGEQLGTVVCCPINKAARYDKLNIEPGALWNLEKHTSYISDQRCE